jgi:proteasome lid subunit RPN8/RPN11
VGPERLRIQGEDWDRLTAYLHSCLPEEGCGLLAGRAGEVDLWLPIENSEHSPTHYHMEHRALVRAFHQVEGLGLELLAAFHSHPQGPAGVSQSDVREWQYPEAALVVCTPGREGWVPRGFIVNGETVREIPFLVDSA